MRVVSITIPHLLNQLLHRQPRLPLGGRPILRLLLVDMEQVVPENSPGEGGLNLLDALFGQVSLLGIRGEHHHVDVDALLLPVESGVPAQVVRRDFVPLCDVRETGIDQRAPVFRRVIAQPLRVLPANGDHRRPHIPCVIRHLPNRLGEVLHLAARAPEAVLPLELYTGTVCHIVQVVLPLTHGLHKILPHLLDKDGGGFPGGVGLVVLILQQLLSVWEIPKESADVLLLFFRGRPVSVLLREHFHTGAGRHIPGAVGQLGRVPTAL